MFVINKVLLKAQYCNTIIIPNTLENNSLISPVLNLCLIFLNGLKNIFLWLLGLTQNPKGSTRCTWLIRLAHLSWSVTILPAFLCHRFVLRGLYSHRIFQFGIWLIVSSWHHLAGSSIPTSPENWYIDLETYLDFDSKVFFSGKTVKENFYTLLCFKSNEFETAAQ